jgi:hypothetical protein
VFVDLLIFGSFSETAGLGEALGERRDRRTQTIFPS